MAEPARTDGTHARAHVQRRLHVESFGTGRPIVLLHGFAMHGGLFEPLVPALAASRRVHVVDLPGHGRSPCVASFDLAALADAVDSALPADDAPLDVLGWSLGGQIAIEWARLRAARIRRLVLVTTTPSFVARRGFPHAMSAQTLARFGDELRASYRLTLSRFLALQVHGSEEGRATLDALRARLFARGEPAPAALASALALLRDTDLRTALGAIATPALVVGGERDAIVPVEATRRLAAGLPQARHVAISGAAHAPFLSHAGAFEHAVLPFLDG
jgi:pimeloyl-[acyl-carrier protein] methyl ester esterase